jgi:hypothetical protein
MPGMPRIGYPGGPLWAPNGLESGRPNCADQECGFASSRIREHLSTSRQVQAALGRHRGCPSGHRSTDARGCGTRAITRARPTGFPRSASIIRLEGELPCRSSLDIAWLARSADRHGMAEPPQQLNQYSQLDVVREDRGQAPRKQRMSRVGARLGEDIRSGIRTPSSERARQIIILGVRYC